MDVGCICRGFNPLFKCDDDDDKRKNQRGRLGKREATYLYRNKRKMEKRDI